MKRGKGIFIFLSIFLISTIFVFAADFSPEVIPLSVNEDISSLFNFTITNLDSVENLTQINITLPTGFIFELGTEGSSVSGNSFSNGSGVLNWEGTPLVLNGSLEYFWFNATPSIPGDYSFNLDSRDSASIEVSNTSSIVEVNDTTNPEVVFSIPVDSGNYSGNLSLTVLVTDDSSLSLVRFNLTNSSGEVGVYLATNTSETSWNFSLDSSSLVSGFYNVSVFVNDSFNNINNSLSILNFRIDNEVPSVTLSNPSSSKNSTNLTISISDSGSGIGTSCSVNRGGASISGSGNSQSLNEEGLTCGTEYFYNITCSDRAGNEGYSTKNISTSVCDSSSSSSTGDSTSESVVSFSWKNTFIISNDDFKSGVEKKLKKEERVKFTFKNETHYLGIINLTSTKVIINVSSNPIQFELGINQSKKIDLEEDGFYDILVLLKGITGKSVNVSMQEINESIPISIAEVSNLNEDNSAKNNKNLSEKTIFRKIGFWITLIVVLLIIIISFILFKINRKKKFGY